MTIRLRVSATTTNNIQFNLNDANLQIISRALNIRNVNITAINTDNNDVYFIVYNDFNEFYMELTNSSQLYVEELTSRSGTKVETFMIIRVMSGVTLILAMIILFPVLYKVNSTREEVLSLLLDIPEKVVKGLYTKCENFVSNLQVGEDDDMVSELEDESFEKVNDDSESQEFHPRKKRKKFKNSGRSQRNFFIKFFGAALCLEAYFVVNYYLSKNLLDQVNSIVPEFNSTSVAEPFYAFANNAERYKSLKAH